jgi:hypothetical protein
MSELEYHRQMCSLVTLIAKHEVLLSRPRYAPDDKATEITSSSIDEQDT